MSAIHKTVRNKTGTSLFLGLWLLPKAKREALYTLFAWVKHLEEVIDSSLDEAEKREIINGWYREFDNIFDKKVPATDIGRRIYKNCMRFKLPKKDFIDTLDSISENANHPLQAPSLKQLTGYCRGVGGITGSLALRIFGCQDEKMIGELSLAMGSAIQITDILLNIKDDANNNRLYIPLELLQKAGITSTDPKTVVVDKNLVEAREDLAQIAAQNYTSAYALLSALDKETVRPLRLILDIYKKYFDTMNQRGWEVISPKPTVSKFYKLKLLIRSWLFG